MQWVKGRRSRGTQFTTHALAALHPYYPYAFKAKFFIV
jgi:hypothetical protein